MDQIRERMYELAYRYRETELWDELTDDQLFAVEHRDGSISYCSVLGMLGEQFALNIYTGEEGFASYLRLIDLAMPTPFDMEDPWLEGEIRNAQKCLSCSFENRDYLSAEEAKEVSDYTRAHGISLRGKNKYAFFLDFTPGLHPCKIEKTEDMERVCDSLEAAIFLSELLKNGTWSSLNIPSYREMAVIPLFCKRHEGWEVNDVSLPHLRFEYPTPALPNELMLRRIKKMKKDEIWQCGAFFSPAYVGNQDAGERPYYPLILLAVTLDPAYVRPIHMGKYNQPELYLDAMANHIIDGGHCPRLIQCADRRCYSLLKDFCNKTGIQLSYDEDLIEYKEAEYDLYSGMNEGPHSDEEAEEIMRAMLESLNDMSDAELRQMPEGMVRALKGTRSLDELVPELYERLQRLFP